MRISSDKLSEVAVKAADEELRRTTWRVFAKYRLRGRGNSRYVEAPGIAVGDDMTGEEVLGENEGWDYQPLVEYDDLFLRFASLIDDGRFTNQATAEETVHDWAETYGVLGLTPVEGFLGRPMGSTAGGKEDTVRAFATEAWEANQTLRLYEAATAKGGPDVKTIASFEHPHFEGRTTQTPGTAREWALRQVQAEVQYQVALHCYPVLYPQKGGGFVQSLGFSSLLGAMWLQMSWLLCSDDARRCRNWECNRVVVFEQPEQVSQGLERNDRSAGYRTRNDKVFCSKRCSNRYNYLTRTKPQRQAASAHELS